MSWAIIYATVFAFYAAFKSYQYFKRRFLSKLPPGPIGLPFLGYLPFLGKEPHKTLTELGKKYGSIYGLYLGPKYTVVVGDYETMKETLPLVATSDRDPLLFDFIPGGAGFGGFNGEEWKEQRRFCVQAMRELGLGRGPWETHMEEEVSLFVEELNSHKGKPIDISRLLISSLSNNIMSLLIGRKLRKGTDDEVLNLLTDFIDVTLRYTGPSDPAIIMPWLRKYLVMFKIAGYDKAAATIEKFCSMISDEVKRHQLSRDTNDENDFMNIYLDQLSKKISAENSKHYFSAKNLEGNTKALFLGGSDTISSSMFWMFSLMAAYPEVQRKVHEEMDEVIGREGQVNYEDRKKFPYTLAVMMETQRVATIVPLMPRMVRHNFSVRGYTIPKGTHIIANTWAVHNDTKLWEQPEKFFPERFLSETKLDSLKAEGLVPFALGKRQCPGDNVAWMEIFLYFVTVMQKFKVMPPEGRQISFDIEFGLVTHLKPHKLVFIDRN